MIFYVLVTGISALVTFGLALLIWKLSTKFRLYPEIRDRDVHTTPDAAARRSRDVHRHPRRVRRRLADQLVPPRVRNPGQIQAILGAALIIVLIGVADDIWDLDWVTKLAGQIIAAGLLAWQGVQLLSLPIGGITIGSPTCR